MARRLSYPKELSDTNLHPAFIQFQYYERVGVKASTTSDLIQLYMPEQTGQPSTVSWDTDKLGYVGRSGVNLFTEGAGPGVSDIANLLKSRGGAKLGAAAVSLLGGQANAEALLGAATGQLPNPYLTMLFRGVDFRTFQFQFKFAPFSESDCQLIDDIIRTMRANALPPGSGPGASMLGYPMECEITYFWKGKENQWLHKFQRAVCTGIDVDYTPNGMFSVMRNGFPSQITVSTKWSEVELVLRDDVKTGRY